MDNGHWTFKAVVFHSLVQDQHSQKQQFWILFAVRNSSFISESWINSQIFLHRLNFFAVDIRELSKIDCNIPFQWRLCVENWNRFLKGAAISSSGAPSCRMTAHLRRTDGAFVHWVIVSPTPPFCFLTPQLLSTPPQATTGRVNCDGLRAKLWRKQKQIQIPQIP